MQYLFEFLQDRINQNDDEVSKIRKKIEVLEQRKNELHTDTGNLNHLIFLLPEFLKANYISTGETQQSDAGEKTTFSGISAALAENIHPDTIQKYKNPPPPTDERKAQMRFLAINKRFPGKWIYIFNCISDIYCFEYHARHIVTEEWLKTLRFNHADTFGVYSFMDSKNLPVYFHPVNFLGPKPSGGVWKYMAQAFKEQDEQDKQEKQSTPLEMPANIVYSHTQPSLFPCEKPVHAFIADGKYYHFHLESSICELSKDTLKSLKFLKVIHSYKLFYRFINDLDNWFDFTLTASPDADGSTKTTTAY